MSSLHRTPVGDLAVACVASLMVLSLGALTLNLWTERPEAVLASSIPAILAALATSAAVVLALLSFQRIREAQQATTSLLDRYGQLFQDNPEPMWIFDDETLQFLDVNRAATLRYGHSKEEFLKLTVLDIRPKQELGRLLADIRAKDRSRHTDGPWLHRTKSGVIFPVEVTSMPIQYEGRPARFVRPSDISAKVGAQEAQEQLRQATELIRAVFHTAPLAVWGLDLNGLVTFWNRTAANWFGWTEEEAIGRKLPVIPRSQLAEFDRWLEDYRQGVQINGEERARVRKDGTTIQCELWSAPLRDAGGAITGTVGIVADITKRSRAEEALRQHMERLAASNEDLQQFAYAASHDLQEPLRDLVVCTQMFEKLFSGVASPQAYEYLEFARKGALTIRALVAGLGEYWRLDQHPLAQEVCSLRTASERAIERLGERISSAGAQIEVKPLPFIKGDPELMEMLFAHLLDNALKFRSQAAPAIQISAQTRGKYCTISVADNGIGIDLRFANRVMQIFKRLSRDYEGVGIGLSLCKKIAERHGGSIELDRNTGGGTTVHVHLPEVMAEPGREAEVAAAKSASR